MQDTRENTPHRGGPASAAFSFVKLLWAILTFVWGVLWGSIAWLARRLFGKISWQAPTWPRWAGGIFKRFAASVRAHPKRSVLVFLVAAALAYGSWYGYTWWKARPKPVEVTFEIVVPGRTEIENEDIQLRKPKPFQITFSDSVAPLANAGKDVAAGVQLEPAVVGIWHWDNDTTLVFTPKEDWPIGVEYTVSMQPALFKPAVVLAKNQVQFTAPAFAIAISSKSFYQDPLDPGLKKAIVELNFSHPVNPAMLEKNIEFKLAKQSDGILGIGKETTKFHVSYDKLKLNAYIHSEPIAIPKDETSINFTLANEVSAMRGGKAFGEVLQESIPVPGLYSLAIAEMEPQVVNNDKNEPEHVLMVQTSATVHERELEKALSVWVLPVAHPDPKIKERDGRYPHSWNTAEVTTEILKISTRLALEAIPAEQEYTQTHSFKYKADEKAQLFVQVEKGVKSFGGYILGKSDGRIIVVQRFPAELKILSEGALLALSGEKKIAVLVRDLPGLRVEIGRVLPSQLQHLVSQANGNYAKPEFYDRFGQDNLVERFERIVPLPNLQKGRSHYEAVDISEYLKNDGAERRGVFLLSVTGYNPIDKYDVTDKEDKRLILVTDLGILVKKSMDGSLDYFVQSIYTGKPVEGATVEVVGKNGVTLFSQITDISGRAHFAKIEGLSRERSPLMVVVKKAGDMSFMPLDKSDRNLDMSRFDTGGAKNAPVSDQLSAYLFSDRGIYRPGDSFNIGMIVKSANWATSIVGLPLEAEVLDARGLTVKREKISLQAGGFMELSYTTQETSPTGNYSVNLYLVKDGRAGAQIGSTSVKVQEFQPDRLKVSARFSADETGGWVSPKGLKALVNAQNLFDTPAENRRVRAEITLSPAFPAFKAFPNYRFYDPQLAKEGYNDKLSDQTTNEKGEAEFNLGLEKYAKASYRVHFLARAFEAQGGRGVAAEASILVSELPYLVGFQTDGALDFVSRGAKRNISIIAINPQAKKTDVQGLTLRLMERKYVSVLSKQSNGTYKYESRKKETLVKESPLTIPAGGFQLSLATDTPGDFAYVIRDAQGLEFNRIDYSVAGKANITRSLERNAELQLTLNKKDYEPGEDIEISVKAPYVGAGLITIERDKVFTHQWFKTDTLASVQKIKLPDNFEGTGYVSVQFIRDPSSDEIFMSPLSYGVVPFETSLSARTNKISLAVPDLVKPGQQLKMKLSVSQPTRVVVFAVDEGILQVARYETPNPLGFFFQKRMLEVRTSQILDLILPEFKKLMEASAPGGDGEGALGKNLNPFKRKRDKPVVYWSGIVDVKGEREFTYQVPDYFNGSMRVMAVAVNDSAIGVAQSKAVVRGDFVISPNVPLAVTPGDEFEVSVGVANNVAGSGKDASVNVTLKTSPHLQVLGSEMQKISIGEMREGVTTYRVKAVDNDKALLGSASLSFTSSIGNKSSKLSTDVSVRPAMPRYAQITMGSFKGSKDVPVTRNMYAEYRHLEAGVSPLPLVLANGLSSYLANFSHACTEQLISQAMPVLILNKRPEFGKAGTSIPTARTLEEAWRVLRTRQNAEGGFGAWTASVQADEFASIYAVHLLLEARERGEPVPADMLQKALDYAQTLAASPGTTMWELRARAYAAYLLTRETVVTTPILTSLRETLESRYPKEWQSDLAGAYIAASYQLLKQDRVASGLIDKQVEQLVKRGKPFDYDRYYDPLIRDAQALYLLARHFPARVKALPPNVMASLVKPIAEAQYNTLSSAYLILALDAYATAVGPDGLGHLTIATVDASGKAKPLVLPNNLIPRVSFAAGTAKLRFTNDANINSYYAVTETGFDKAAPKTELRAGMEILREYVDANGKAITSVAVGDEITVRLKFRAVGLNNARTAVSNVALVDLMPGGFEPVLDAPAPPVQDAGMYGGVPDESGEGSSEGDEGSGDSTREEDAESQNQEHVVGGLSGGKSNWTIDYADVREDRIVFYGTVTADLGEISYRIKATNKGRFIVPPAYAESMYERGVQARSLGGQYLTVVAAEKGK